MDSAVGENALFDTEEVPERAAPQPAPRRLLPPLSWAQVFRAAIQAFRDYEKPVSDMRPSIEAVASKEPKGSSEHMEATSIAAIYSVASNIIRKLREPGFARGSVGVTIRELITNMEDLFPQKSPLRRAVSEELSWTERETLVYSLLFLHLDRTYFVHKGMRVPEPILEYLRRDDVRMHGVRYLKESLANLSKSDRPFTRHLELGFCLLSGDDSFELAELVEESTRTSDQGIDGTPNREAIERLEKGVRDSVASLHKEFTRITEVGRANREGFSAELTRFLQRTETTVDHFGVFLNLMNWCMAPYAEEPAHRPFIALLRGHIDSMEKEIRTILGIVADIARHYPAGSPNASTRNGTLISILDMRTRLIRYTLVKIRLNTAPILFEQAIHKKEGETAGNLALYRKEVETFDVRMASAQTDLASIVRICGELAARGADHTAQREDQDDPVSGATADRVHQIIGEALVSLPRDLAYAQREQENIRRYQELCNRPYLAFTLGAYSSPDAEIDAAVERGVHDLFRMQEELAPERMRGMGSDWRTKRQRFVEEFAVSPPKNPNTFRTTAENAYQLFRTLEPHELSDKLLLELVTLLAGRIGSDADERQSRRTSLRVSFFLLEATRTLRKRLANGKSSPEADMAVHVLSDFVGSVSQIRTSSDTFGRICLELGRIHAAVGSTASRRRSEPAGDTRDRLFECFDHAYHLHPNLMAVLSDMEEAEKRGILAVMRQANVSGVQAGELAARIHGEVMLRGAQERREALSRQFSDEIRTTVQELLEQEGVSRRPEERAIANLEKRLQQRTLPEISRSVLHGLWTIHFVVLSTKETENPDPSESLLAAVRSRNIARGRHITPLATYGGIVAFVEHDPMATERVKEILRFEWLDRTIDDLCVSVVDLQDGLDVGKLTDSCVDALVRRNGSGMRNACVAWVIDPETGIAYAASAGKDRPEKKARSEADTRRPDDQEEESCYLEVTDADRSDKFESARGTTIYSRQVFMRTTVAPPPPYLRPGSTIMLYVADHTEYLRHLVRVGLLDRTSARGAGLKASTALESAIPLIGTIVKVEKNGELIVNVTWPLTLARYHLATLRAKRNAGIPFLSTDIIRGNFSLQAVLRAQQKDGRVVSATVPSVSFAHERGEQGRSAGSDMAVGRAVSFFGPDSYRIVFELPSQTIAALDSILGKGGNMARPLRIIGDFRKTLATQIRMDCQKQGMVSAEEALQRVRETAQAELEKQVELEKDRQYADGESRKKEIGDLTRWFDSIVRVAERTLSAEESYTAESLDDAMHESLEEMISRISWYAAIFEALAQAKGIGEVVASPAGSAIRLGGKSFFPKDPEFDRLTPPVVTPGLVELSFRYVADDASRWFIQQMRARILERGGGAKRTVL